MIQPQIYTAIAGNSDVIAIVGNKIYPVRAPQRTVAPYVIYQLPSMDPVNSISGDSGLDLSRLVIKCWASTYAVAHQLAFAVRNALVNTSSFELTTMTQYDDEDEETMSFCVVTEYSIWSEFDGGALDPILEIKTDVFTGDGVTDEWNFSNTFRSGSLMIFKNGVLSEKDIDYIENEDFTGVTFSSPPAGAGYPDKFLAFFAKSTVYAPGVTPKDPILEMRKYPFVGDGTTREFLFPYTFREGTLLIFKNGALAESGVLYNELSDRSGIEFINPPVGGEYADEFLAFYVKS